MNNNLQKLAHILGLKITTEKGLSFDLLVGIPMGTVLNSQVAGDFTFHICKNGLMVTVTNEENNNANEAIAYKFNNQDKE